MTPRAVRSVSPCTAPGILVQARSTTSCRRRVPNAYLLCRAREDGCPPPRVDHGGGAWSPCPRARTRGVTGFPTPFGVRMAMGPGRRAEPAVARIWAQTNRCCSTRDRRVPPPRRRGEDPRRGRAADPGVGVVAVLFPVAGNHVCAYVDAGHPLDALVSVHLRHHDPGRCAVWPGERPAVHLEGEHHVGEQRLLGGQGVVVGRLVGDEAERSPAPLRACRRDHVVEADAGPANVRHRPAGDAVEVRDLLCAWEGAQVGERERRGTLDVTDDAQAVVGRRDVGHARSDRVDAPPARRDERLHAVGDNLAEEADASRPKNSPASPAPSTPRNAVRPILRSSTQMV